VLGIDEHTALLVDLDARTVSVTGRGGLTVRRRGVSRVFPAGERLGLDTLFAAARGDAASSRPATPDGAAERTKAQTPGESVPAAAKSPLMSEVAKLEQAFEAAIAARRASDAAEAVLTLDRSILEWSADTLQTDEPDRARAVLYSLIHRLGEAAGGGLRDPRELLAPVVDGLIALRKDLRAAKQWELADRVRDRLAAAGIELRDSPAGTVWELRSGAG
jgi:cysteinyl-tRNA synthetase